MSKYNDLVRVLDTICEEAPTENKAYHPEEGNVSALEQSRSRAYIHLFLKAKFGLLSFEEREQYVTDGSADGGIDAYYVDSENRKFYFIQSKFRNSDSNFVGKSISYAELLSMEIDRISHGETNAEDGSPYNYRILRLIERMQSIDNLGRYEYVVILLANIRERDHSKLSRLIGPFKTEVFNHERLYTEILFPVIAGSYYDVKELKIVLNITRESSGNRIQYYAETEYGECTVNACFVPTIEIAKALYKYKNAILRFNPRSYLELVRGSVNARIADSIQNKRSNEFALFNNGITMLSDDTEYSDRVGRRNIAELHLSNPQIINGGQTAYTLSRIYEKALHDSDLDVFDGKEVLLKVISFNDSDTEMSRERSAGKLRLIEQISVATNQQSPVSEADRRANDKVQVELQQEIFKDFGLYYERKRGEFSDGIAHGYILRNQLIDREDFLRCRVAINNPVSARRMAAGYLFDKPFFDSMFPSVDGFRKVVYAYKAYKSMDTRVLSEAEIKYYAKFAVVYVVANHYEETIPLMEYDQHVSRVVSSVLSRWNGFEQSVMKGEENRKYYFKEQGNGKDMKQVDANWQGYYKGRTLQTDLDAYFGLGSILVEEG